MVATSSMGERTTGQQTEQTGERSTAHPNSAAVPTYKEACEAIRALLQEVERLRAEVDRLRECEAECGRLWACIVEHEETIRVLRSWIDEVVDGYSTHGVAAT